MFMRPRSYRSSVGMHIEPSTKSNFNAYITGDLDGLYNKRSQKNVPISNLLFYPSFDDLIRCVE